MNHLMIAKALATARIEISATAQNEEIKAYMLEGFNKSVECIADAVNDFLWDSGMITDKVTAREVRSEIYKIAMGT